ncbi:glyoxylase-like metal-dependent hydrolase (beta-lactamase superfamily II) [Actinocorallia herbida]|uniref:Glyoxylase-like metal-dependent hydrolase (Beta-lactamase superfamily II) n=1 Tax=Actinocorallia herbida TaxID=58109 RepID=A0A3N1D537_9ACTN|nr:MBL fold metallo-hydrolase [Actinocorallia herbida]ROO88637.1 glyoxylase-like metal-dependent hydrolase (beta-lactamase superfamily II) [Actinocorallia herbida]
MKIHHVNCGSMRMPTAPLVCHVLVVETDAGLVLVDTGFGLRDVAEPGRLGPMRRVIRPVLAEEETAVRRVEALGFRREDVRHIVLTHFDLDHIGGLADFPEARVHVTAAEAEGAVHAPSLRERVRYRPVQWAHGPRLVEHGPGGEAWRGFAAARELTEIASGIVLVPLPGHTRGHAAVAVDAGDRWVLHCGDAFYHRGALDSSRIPFVLRAQETLVAFDGGQVRRNQARLAALHAEGSPDLRIVSSHDPSLLAAAQAPS